MIKRILFIVCIGISLYWCIGVIVEAQEAEAPAQGEAIQLPMEKEAKEAGTPATKEGNVTLDFKDADIQNVLRILSYKSGVNIVASKEVVGTVTIRLVDVPWQEALDVILKTSGFAYERDANIITVSTVDVLKERREKEKELKEIEPVTTKVFTLQFLDAADAKKLLEPQLSPQGRISVLEVTGQKGWEFGAVRAGGTTEEEGKARRLREAARSRALIITDTPTYLERIAKVLKDIDIKPNQVLIEARIMEVSRDVLKDLGVEFGTGTRLETHAKDRTAGQLTIGLGDKTHDGAVTARNYSEWGNEVTPFNPANFNPKATSITAANAGLEILYKRLFGKEFEVMVHALEEDVRTNTLSAPRILTLSGQEAVIMVGEKYPILATNISGTSGTSTTTLDYYQDIGIQLYVVPQISGENDFVNMIIHPVVSSFTQTVGANAYPRLITREAETQVLMQDGETIVIGGLLKDVKSKGKVGVPILSDIPIIGGLFTRRTNDVEKIDLLIFITARVVRPGVFSEQEMAMIQKALNAGQPDVTFEKSPAKKEKKVKPKKDE